MEERKGRERQQEEEEEEGDEEDGEKREEEEEEEGGGGSCGGGSRADSSCSSINTKLPAVRALNRDQTAGETEEKGSAVSFPPHRTVLLSLI